MAISQNVATSQANPRGGTVAGTHWVEYSFNQAYALGEMWIWNYNEISHSDQGFKEVTIEYSLTGSVNPGDWTTIYDGAIPRSNEQPASPVDLVVDFDEASARYVVITTDLPPEQNYGSSEDAGLSEVRFHAVIEQPCTAIVHPNVLAFSFPTISGNRYRLQGTISLLTPSWVGFNEFVWGDGGEMTLYDIPGAAGGSYRVVTD